MIGLIVIQPLQTGPVIAGAKWDRLFYAYWQKPATCVAPAPLQLQHVLIRPEIRMLLEDSYRQRIRACLDISTPRSQ